MPNIKRGWIERKKQGQVWVETVIYTLIALTVIGLFLSFARPKIEEIQDKAIIEQSIQMLENIKQLTDNIVQGGAGNQRVIELAIKKGSLQIDSSVDVLIFEMDGRYMLSEPGEEVTIGGIIAKTEKQGSLNTVTLISNYSSYNITYNGGDENKVIGRSPSVYKVVIYNRGESSGKTQIDFSI